MPDHMPLSSVSITSFLEDIPEMAIIFRDDGMIMDLNSICARNLGVPREVVIGHFNLFDNIDVLDPALAQGYRDAFRGKSVLVPPSPIDIQSNKSGIDVTTTVKWVDTILIPLQKRDDGTAAYVLVIQRDVTELMSARLAMEGAQQEINAQRDVIASLEAARREIEAQKATIQELSTPVIEVWDGILTLPLLGHFNAERVNTVTSQLLEAIVRTRAKYAILDLTGMPAIDTGTGDHLRRIVGAVALLGTTGVLVGIQPAIAQTLVGLGVELSHVRVYQNLRQALKACMREQERA